MRRKTHPRDTRARAKKLKLEKVEVRLSGEQFAVDVTVFEYFRAGTRTVYVERRLLSGVASENHAKQAVNTYLERYYPRVKCVARYIDIALKGAQRETIPIADAALRAQGKLWRIYPHRGEVRLTGTADSVGIQLREFYSVGRRGYFLDRSFFKAGSSDEEARTRVVDTLSRHFPGIKVPLAFTRVWPEGNARYGLGRGSTFGITHKLPPKPRR